MIATIDFYTRVKTWWREKLCLISAGLYVCSSTYITYEKHKRGHKKRKLFWDLFCSFAQLTSPHCLSPLDPPPFYCVCQAWLCCHVCFFIIALSLRPYHDERIVIMVRFRQTQDVKQSEIKAAINTTTKHFILLIFIDLPSSSSLSWMAGDPPAFWCGAFSAPTVSLHLSYYHKSTIYVNQSCRHFIDIVVYSTCL